MCGWALRIQTISTGLSAMCPQIDPTLLAQLNHLTCASLTRALSCPDHLALKPRDFHLRLRSSLK